MRATWCVAKFHVKWLLIPSQWAGLLQYLDVPSLSLRNLLLPDILENNDLARDYFGWKRGVQPDFSDTDLRHVSCLAPTDRLHLLTPYRWVATATL